MIKLTNTFLIGLMAAGLLVGCGNSSSNDGMEVNEGTEQVETDNDSHPVEANNGTGGGTPATPPPSMVSTFGSNVMPVLESKCKNCHGSNGNFMITTTSGTYTNITALKGSAAASGQYLLDKGSNTIGHGGGMVIATSSAEYATIKSWIDAGAENN